MTPDLLHQLPFLVIVIFAASLFQGATGFGFGLVAVAALSLMVELKVATPLLAVLNLPVILYLFWRLRHAVVWPRIVPILAGLMLGIPFGIFVLVTWPHGVLLRILGCVLIAAGLRAATRNSGSDTQGGADKRGLLGTVGAAGVGATTGALGGAFNTGGPPIIAYFYCRPGTKEQRTASLQSIFAISAVTRIAVMAAPPASLYTKSLLLAVLACLPGAVLGMVVGYLLFRRLPTRALEVFVAVFLVGIGLKLLIWP